MRRRELLPLAGGIVAGPAPAAVDPEARGHAEAARRVGARVHRVEVAAAHEVEGLVRAQGCNNAPRSTPG